MSQKEFTIEALFKATGAEQFSRDFDKATGHVKGFDTSTKKSTGGLKDFMGGVGKIAGAIGITKLVGKGFEMISDSIGGAVKRFDTLSNANKVFENMGFGAEETARMMDSLVESLDGLPTASNEAIQNIQRISMANGDIESAGKLFEHLNYAVLATGKSQEDVNSTVEMFSRSLQRGTMNGHEWEALMRNMGPTMNNMADMMGISINELQEGLSNGTISFEEFEESIHELAVNGNGDFADLETQARDMTSGIGTAMENLSNRIEAGIMQGILEPLDEALSENGLPKLGEMIDILSSGIRDAITGLAPYVTASVEAIVRIVETFSEMREVALQMFEELFPNFDVFKLQIEGIWESIKTAFSEGNMEFVGERFSLMFILIFQQIDEALPVMLEKGLEIISNIIEGITTKVPELYEKAAEFMVMFYTVLADFIPKLLVTGMEFVVSLLKGIGDKMPEWISMAVEMVVKMAQTIGDNLPTIIAKGVEMLGKLAQGFKDNFPAIVAAGVQMIAELLGSILKNLPKLVAAGLELIVKLAVGLIKAIPDVLKAMADIATGIIDAVGDISLVDAGKAIINGFVGGLKSAWNAGKKFIGGIGGWIADNKGPISYDRKLLVGAGNAIIGGLNKGLQESFPDVQRTVSGMAGAIENSLTSSPVMDINGSVTRSNVQVRSAVSHEISNKGAKQPAYIHLSMGGQSFRAYVENISSEQGRITDLEMQF